MRSLNDYPTFAAAILVPRRGSIESKPALIYPDLKHCRTRILSDFTQKRFAKSASDKLDEAYYMLWFGSKIIMPIL